MFFVDFCNCFAFVIRVYLSRVISMFFNNSENLKYYDLIVVGNTLNAVVSAGMAAKNGKTVALVTESELLFSEYSESLLGFIKKDSNLFNMLVDMGVAPINIGNEYHIPAGMASKTALRFLKENNVEEIDWSL